MEYWKKHHIVFLFLIILVIGAVFRFYQLGDWLHFELDQARDARVIDRALAGDVLDLPLLGPKAGGTFLRLGPGFYWLEYVGALWFGGSVVGGAFMVALASLLSIPLFYLIARRLFSTSISLGLCLLFSVSAYMVLYGRFAWNPNFIPFFTLLGLYALLRTVDRDERYQGRFLVLSALALGMATHMHFLAFLALPVIGGLFLVILRPRIALRFWVLAFTVFVALYVPMVLNEVATGGQNTQEFVAALSEKSTKEDHPLVEKAVRTVSEFGLHAIVILTGFEGATFPSVIIKDGTFGSVCDSKCDQGKWYGVAGVLILGLSVLLLVWRWWQTEPGRTRDVLLLMMLWFGVTFALFLPLSYGIAPRFFLLNAPLLFLLLGLLAQWIGGIISRKRSLGIVLSCGLIVLFVALNVHFLVARFDELARAGTESVVSAPDRILKEQIRVTLYQQETIVDFLERRSREEQVAIYMFSEPQYRRALKYLMERRGIENDVLGFSAIYRSGAYFLIVRAQSNIENRLEKYLPSFTVGPITSFGTLVAIELVPKPEAIMGERQDFSIPEKKAPSQAPPRYTLREFLARGDTTLMEEDEGADVDVTE